MSVFDDVIGAWLRGEAPLAPITALLGITPLEVKAGAARLTMQATAAHHNAMGTLHGGVFGDFADVAFGCALASVLPDGVGFTSVDLHTRFFKPVREGALVAAAKVVRQGKTTAYLECEITDEGGALVAKATSTCLLLTR